MFNANSVNTSFKKFEDSMHELDLTPNQFNNVMRCVSYAYGGVDQIISRQTGVLEELIKIIKLIQENTSLNNKEKLIAQTHLTRALSVALACLDQNFINPLPFLPQKYINQNKKVHQELREANNAVYELAQQLIITTIQLKYPELPKPDPEANRLN
jgi:hypothetical protein